MRKAGPIDKESVDRKHFLADAHHALVTDRTREVAMFAVVKETRDTRLALRQIDVDQDLATRKFDDDLLESGFAPFISEATIYTSFEQSLELKNTIGVLPVDDVQENLLDDRLCEGKSPILSFLDDLSHAKSAFLNNEIPQLELGEMNSAVGLVFSYQVVSMPDPIYAYQKIMPSAALKESRFIYRATGGSKFKLFTHESIKIGTHFDFLVACNCIFAWKPKTIVSQFAYARILQHHAEQALEGLEHLLIGTDLIGERISANKTRTVNKLLKIRCSPVLKMPAKELRRRLESLELYKGKFSFNDDDRIVVEAAEIMDLLKMLNDEILQSPLTDEVYESEIKSPYERTQQV